MVHGMSSYVNKCARNEKKMDEKLHQVTITIPLSFETFFIICTPFTNWSSASQGNCEGRCYGQHTTWPQRQIIMVDELQKA